MPDATGSTATQRMAADLAALAAADRLRKLTLAEGIQLGSNDYLGLSRHPRLKEAIARSIEEDERLASTGSRLLSGNSERWERLESEFAEFLGVEAALYFPSGYAANVGLLSSLLQSTDIVFSDAANHSSIIDGIRLSRARKVIVPHLDVNYLEDALRRENGAYQKFVIIESIFSMEGDRAPIGELAALCERYAASLIVDEAHATGVEGERGRGLVRVTERGESVLATVHTCGKALAAMGAFVAGSHTLRDFLINHARTFIFSTALPPYCAAHVSAGLNLAAGADAERSHLNAAGRYLRCRMQASGLDTGGSDSQIVPLILGSNEAALRFAAALTAAGFSIRAIRPPTVPDGAARLRISLNAGLSFADMDCLVGVLAAAREDEVVAKR